MRFLRRRNRENRKARSRPLVLSVIMLLKIWQEKQLDSFMIAYVTARAGEYKRRRNLTTRDEAWDMPAGYIDDLE